MRYCKKCTMPDTRPGITFDSEGVCSACRHYENRKNVDWDARFKEFEAYCNKYRGMNGPGGYDCIAIATAFTQALKCRNTRNCAGKALPYAATRRHGTALYLPPVTPPSGWA